jgi:hypothetical protein
MNVRLEVGKLVMHAPAEVEQSPKGERWSPPVATLFIVATSLALWAGIFWCINLLQR